MNKQFLLIFMLIIVCCSQQESEESERLIYSESAIGCDGQFYLAQPSSPYVLPFPVGQSYYTGLTNCSSSYHSSGNPDQYAFDFNMPEGTPFVAARAGIVYEIGDLAEETNIVGNFVALDHGDGSFGLYLHSPNDGISVNLNEKVKQGEILGVTGKSGLAGYPHLHFIVVNSTPDWPYTGLAVSFRNVQPADIILEGNKLYTAKNY